MQAITHAIAPDSPWETGKNESISVGHPMTAADINTVIGVAKRRHAHRSTDAGALGLGRVQAVRIVLPDGGYYRGELVVPSEAEVNGETSSEWGFGAFHCANSGRIHPARSAVVTVALRADAKFGGLDRGQSVWEMMLARLAEFGGLRPGWDGYHAAPPAVLALHPARAFLEFLRGHDFPPAKVAPSVVGGVGFTFRRGGLSAYVEFRNTGNAHAAFMGAAAGPEVVRLGSGDSGFADTMGQVENHLNGRSRAAARDVPG